MKRVWHIKNSVFMATTVPLFAIVCSCSAKPETTAEKDIQSITAYKEIKVDTTMSLFASYEKPDCHLKLNFEVPTKATSKNTLEIVKTMIASLTQDGAYANGSNDLDAMVRNYTKSYIRNYLEEGNDAITNFGNDMRAAETWMSYEEQCEGKALYNDNGIFSYSVRTYTYTGGAHGNSNNCVASIDLQTRSNISLETLFNAAALEEVRLMIVDCLNDNYQLLDEEFDVTENFYLSDKGVTFVYDPFEIAAYSYGEIAVTLGWERLRTLIAASSPIIDNPLLLQADSIGGQL